ncbi:MAG: type II toxin-antitoxin system RelE/ParE family toxin [Lentisphaerota bacterium]
MNHKIEWRNKAVKQLLKIPQQDAKRIKDTVSSLENDEGAWHNVKKLVNHQYSHRLRVGNYRVLFNSGEALVILVIEEVKKRDESTY